jgi:hypothetical protein
MQSHDILIRRGQVLKKLVQLLLPVEVSIGVHQIVVDFGDQMVGDVYVFHRCVCVIEHLVETRGLAGEVLKQNGHVTEDGSCDDGAKEEDEGGEEGLSGGYWGYFSAE